MPRNSDRKRNYSEATHAQMETEELNQSGQTEYHDARSRSSEPSQIPITTRGQEENFKEWRNVKQANADKNRNFGNTRIEESKASNVLPTDQDGKLSFFWTDAHEENFGAEIYLFGKVYVPATRNYQSCCVIVKGMQRELYALPKFALKGELLSDEEEKSHLMEMHKEFQEIKNKSLKKVTNWKCKFV